jgi:hypothetical protein
LIPYKNFMNALNIIDSSLVDEQIEFIALLVYLQSKSSQHMYYPILLELIEEELESERQKGSTHLKEDDDDKLVLGYGDSQIESA